MEFNFASSPIQYDFFFFFIKYNSLPYIKVKNQQCKEKKIPLITSQLEKIHKFTHSHSILQKIINTFINNRQ